MVASENCGMNGSMKVCFKCGVTRPREDFYKNPRMADGRMGKCKQCTKDDVHANRIKNLERIREYDRNRAKNPKRQAHIKAWRQADVRRTRCHNAVARAVRSGRLTPTPCVQCGCEKTVAHHPDYNKPLDVVWLCQPCHIAIHQQEKTDGRPR
jgi:hypothetical protein